jgi:PhnB protein
MSSAAAIVWVMSSQNATAAPPGYAAVTPWIISRDTARLIEFTKDAFGARELGRVPGPDGRIGHAEVRIADSVVMMFDAGDGWPDTPAFLRLYVADADEVYQRAIAAGAVPVTAVTGLFFGDRVGRIRDPLGNIWWLQAHVEDVDPAELTRRPADPAAAGRCATSRPAWMTPCVPSSDWPGRAVL